jgi:hypothetical protein
MVRVCGLPCGRDVDGLDVFSFIFRLFFLEGIAFLR